MASVTIYLELAPVEPTFGSYTQGIRLVGTRKTQPKQAHPLDLTRWVLVRLEVEDYDSLFKNPQERGPFGLRVPMVDAILEEGD